MPRSVAQRTRQGTETPEEWNVRREREMSENPTTLKKFASHFCILAAHLPPSEGRKAAIAHLQQSFSRIPPLPMLSLGFGYDFCISFLGTKTGFSLSNDFEEVIPS